MVRLFGKLSFSFLIVFLIAFNVNAGGAIAGKVTILKGQVFIKRGSAKIPVKKDDTILESDVIESEAGTARITMIDSNLVDVYPRSRVEIAKYVYKPNQDQKDVELKVDFGKIKSTVNQKYDGAKNKFQVKTPSAVAGVRGTVFTAEYDAVKKISKVVTIEGLVAVTKMIDRERQSPPVFVRPDQVVKIDVEQSKAEQPRDLKPEERESAQKQDKDLGYQYDPKKEPNPSEQGDKSSTDKSAGEKQISSSANSQPNLGNSTDKSGGQAAGDRPNLGNSIERNDSREEKRERPLPTQEIAIKEVKEVPEQVKEISVVEPVKEIKEQAREQIKEIKNNLKDRLREDRESKRDAKRERQQENNSNRQKQSEEEQARRQKQLEEEQIRKQKLLEEEQARRQKLLEEEQLRRQQELEEAAKRAEAARLAEEIARRAETTTTIIEQPPKIIDSTIPNLLTQPKY